MLTIKNSKVTKIIFVDSFTVFSTGWIYTLLILTAFLISASQHMGMTSSSQTNQQNSPSSPLSLELGNEVVTIQAERQSKTGQHEYVAEGNVEIRHLNILLKADLIRGNNQTLTVSGDGNIYFEQGLTFLKASRFNYDLSKQSGVFYEVSGKTDVEIEGKKEPGFIFEAREVHKLGSDQYRIIDGMVTSCEGKPPKWSFSAKTADFKVNQPINLKNAVFRIKKIPLLYSPFLRTPTSKTQRKSGFLIPSIGNSSNRGRSVSGAFFLTLGRSADLLTRADYYSKRGPAGGLEFKARPSENSSISARGYFALDRLGFGGQNAQIQADTQLNNGFRAVADIDIVSSQAFRQVYGDNINTIAQPDEVSSAFLTRNFSSDSFNIFGERRATVFSGERGVTSRTFPSFNLNGNARRLKNFPVYFSYDTSVEALSRSDAQLRTPAVVQRFDFNPKLSFPIIQWSGINLTSSISLRETFYSNRLDNNKSNGIGSKNLIRSALNLEVKWNGPGIQKIFNYGENQFKHLIEPEITYRYITGINEFTETIRFDEKDLIANTNEVEYLLNNRFFSKSTSSDGGMTTSEFLSISIGQKHFFDPTFGGAIVPGRRNVFFPLNTLSAFAYLDGSRQRSPLISRIRFTPANRYTVDFRADYDSEVGKLRATSVSSRINLSELFLDLTYYNTKNIPPTQFRSNQIRASIGRYSRFGLSGIFSFVYDLNAQYKQYSAAQLAYNWDCCGIAVELRQVGLTQFNPRFSNESQLRFSFFLKNIGSFGTLREKDRIF